MAGVLVAIDWENVRQGSADFVERVSVDQVCQAFRGVASRFGDYRGGTVFGDWTLRPEDARSFEARGLQAYNVLRSRSGKDRSDPAIILEVYDWVRDRQDVGAFVLGSGDSDFKELIRRAGNRGRQVVICAFGNTIASELKTMTPIFPLEAELKLTPKLPLSAQLPGFPQGSEATRWVRFIQRLESMERQLPYVVLNYLKTLLGPAWGAETSQIEIQSFLADALKQGILETFEVSNPKLPGKAAVAIRLNKQHPIVVQVLSQKGTP